jgi:hypothetical protein
MISAGRSVASLIEMTQVWLRLAEEQEACVPPRRRRNAQPVVQHSSSSSTPSLKTMTTWARPRASVAFVPMSALGRSCRKRVENVAVQ